MTGQSFQHAKRGAMTPQMAAIPCSTCGNPISTHHGYYRAKRRGYGYCTQSCEAAAKTKRSDEDACMRFLERVDKPDDESCWPYIGRLNRAGYGQFDWEARPWLAHRFMWQIVFGDIPDGLFVCHACDNPTCCNPGHLWLGTCADNTRDMWTKGRARVVSPKGEQHGCAKLTESDIVAIRNSSMSRRALAAQYFVTPEHIRNIQVRKAWKHVE